MRSPRFSLPVLIFFLLALAGAFAQEESTDNTTPPQPDPAWTVLRVSNVNLYKTLVRATGFDAKDHFHPVNVNNWWGYVNERGYMILWPRFDWTDRFRNDYARATYRGKTGFLNRNANLAFDRLFDWAQPFSEDYAAVGIDPPGGGKRKFGYINVSGRYIIEPQFDDALDFHGNVAAVLVKDRVAFIDARGKAVLPPRFSFARSFSEGLAAVRVTNEAAADDKTVAAPVDPKAKPADPLATRMGFVDRTGKFQFLAGPNELEDLGDMRQNMARIRHDGKWGYMNRAFRVVVQPVFEDARDFHEGYAAVKVKGKWGFINLTGKMAIEPAFEWAYDFQEKFALVRVRGRYGFIDVAGNWSIKPLIPVAEPFEDGRARVWVDTEYFGLTDATGNLYWAPRNPEGFSGTVADPWTADPTDPQRPFQLRATTVVDLPPYRAIQPNPYLEAWQMRDWNFLPRPNMPAPKVVRPEKK